MVETEYKKDLPKVADHIVAKWEALFGAGCILISRSRLISNLICGQD